MALAGFAAGNEIMTEFESGWKAVLADSRWRPAAPYLHMNELRSESRKSPFSVANGWNGIRRKRLISDVVEYLETLDKARSRVFVCGVDVDAVKKREASGIKVASPVRFCTHFCPHYVMAWFAREYPGIVSEAHFYFDRSEPFFYDFHALRKTMESNLFEFSGNREAWQLVKSITETNMIGAPALQVADLLAWGTVRQTLAPPTAFLKEIAVIVKRVIPSSWSRWDDSNLHEATVPQ
jgi:hypothetical protein